MLSAKCINKIKKGNRIIAYQLQDNYNNIVNVTAVSLKQAIHNKQINIVNLTLTSDGKLIDSARKLIDLHQFETEDYQHRGGEYPASGKPDTIQAGDDWLQFSFKNTSEDVAKAWVRKFANKNSLDIQNISSWQDGDYTNDWVMVEISIK